MANKYSLVIAITGCILVTIGPIIGIILHYTLEPREGTRRSDVVADCIPEKDTDESEDLCGSRSCVWMKPAEGGPWCTYPDGSGYTMINVTNTTLGPQYFLRRIDRPTLFGGDISELVILIEEQTEHRLRIKIYDANKARYEVPPEAVSILRPSQKPTSTQYTYRMEDGRGHFGLVVTRKEDNTVIFDTTVPGLTFSDQYIQITTKLAMGHVYGFGEHNHKQFHHDMNWRKWTIFTRDVAPVDDWNLYGAQPFYMALDNSEGRAHGVLLLNSNAMDIVLQPDPFPGISYHVIGGVLDFYIFLGPTPEAVVQQFTEAVGRSMMVPYWSLGFQLSRWGYKNLSHMEMVVKRNYEAGIPQDVQYGDIDYMQSKLDFTYDNETFQGLPEFVQELHDVYNKKFIIILDNFIGANTTIFDMKLGGEYLPFSQGMEQDIFIKNSTNETLYGEVWPGLSVYPDFTLLNRSGNWWRDQCADFYYNWSVQYDALWIDMNEPSNFLQGSTTGCLKNNWNYPPYVPNVLGAADNGGMLYDKTICMDAIQAWGKHYDVHSLYGHSHAIVTHSTLAELFPDRRPFVLTRSNFIGTQRYSMHWLGDNQSEWPNLHWSIIGMMEYSLFGFSMTGADICGFWYNATEEMCQRWTQLGAFYPYSRNHNADTWDDQDPAAFSPEMQRVSRDILLLRYRILPYMYTLMHNSHIHGDTVVRPLLHEFYTDNSTWAIDTQFLLGPAFMISPALQEGQRYVQVYVPAGRWYDFYTGIEVNGTQTWQNISTPLDHINLHMRGGYVMPWQLAALTTTESRELPMGLTVALGDPPSFAAHGSLFWDDGQSSGIYETGMYNMIHFNCSENVLQTTIVHWGYNLSVPLHFTTVNIWGLAQRPSLVTVDGATLPAVQVQYDVYAKTMNLVDLQLDISANHTVSWMYN